MNWQHFRAFLWLRWRMRINQTKKAGVFNAIVLVILAVGSVLLATGLFVGSFLLGFFALRDASPTILLLVWDGLVVAFIFCWMIGLVSELQRSESLALDKFLHLPVSLSSAFLINYFSSFMSFNLLIFVPSMVGLALGLTFGKGPEMLVLFPLLAAFLLMVTALTYQFQGWLASLMANKRRRRTIIFLLTVVLILLSQAGNLVNFIQPWKSAASDEARLGAAEKMAELQRSLASGQITLAEFQKRNEELNKQTQIDHEELDRQMRQQWERTAGIANLVLPPGWLPLGAKSAAEGSQLPAVLGTLGLALIGSASLWRSYRTTLRLYTGQFTSGKRRAVSVAPKVLAPAQTATGNLLEKQLPWVSEQASAITMAGIRSLLRAPEVKMTLLTPIIMGIVFGSMLFRHSTQFPELVRPLMAAGGMAMVLLGMVQIVGNQFGYDRNGFRVFVLCGARRADILMGKNIALAPLALGMGLLLACLLEIAFPMRLDHLLAILPLLTSMYLVFCMLANWLSILAPVHVAASSLRARNLKGLALVLHLAFVFVFPMALAPTLLPLAVEFIAESLGWVSGVPIFLLLSLLECATILYLYRLVLIWQGEELQSREQKILEVVRTKTE